MALKIKKGTFLQQFLPMMAQLQMVQDQADIYRESKMAETADYFSQMSDDRRAALKNRVLELLIENANKWSQGQPNSPLASMSVLKGALPSDLTAGVTLPPDMAETIAAARGGMLSGLGELQAGTDISSENLEQMLKGYGIPPTMKVTLQAVLNRINREKLGGAEAARLTKERELTVREGETAARVEATRVSAATSGRKVQKGTLENLDEQIKTSKAREGLYARDLATLIKQQNIELPQNFDFTAKDVGDKIVDFLKLSETTLTPELQDSLAKLDEERAKQEQLYIHRGTITGDIGKQVYEGLVIELKAKGFTMEDLDKNADLIGYLKSQSIDVGVLKRMFK